MTVLYQISTPPTLACLHAGILSVQCYVRSWFLFTYLLNFLLSYFPTNKTSTAITLVISQLPCSYIACGLNKTIVSWFWRKQMFRSQGKASCGVRAPDCRCYSPPLLGFHFLEQVNRVRGIDCEVVWSSRTSNTSRWISWRWIWSWHLSPTWDICLCMVHSVYPLSWLN